MFVEKQRCQIPFTKRKTLEQNVLLTSIYSSFLLNVGKSAGRTTGRTSHYNTGVIFKNDWEEADIQSVKSAQIRLFVPTRWGQTAEFVRNLMVL